MNTAADILSAAMRSVYEAGLTTCSGGNLSLRDGDDIWITPSGIDKGALQSGDICRVKPDGTVLGPHKPSTEWPFHAAIYKRRPDLGAVLHAHPPGLVAFSVARLLPNAFLTLEAAERVGAVSMAAYAVPGSALLGANVAKAFSEGANAVLLENHGVCVGGSDMRDARARFVLLEQTALLDGYARRLGKPKALQILDIHAAQACAQPFADEFCPGEQSEEEAEARRTLSAYIRRMTARGLSGGADCVCSLRLSADSFLMTPEGGDRARTEAEDLVLIRDGRRERGKTPSRAARLHQAVYTRHADVGALFGASPPHAMAFAVTDAPFDARTIPESYIFLRSVQKVAFRTAWETPERAAALFSEQTPVLVWENCQVLAAGCTAAQAFDRLEVAEATACSLLEARLLGTPVPMSDEAIRDIHEAFGL